MAWSFGDLCPIFPGHFLFCPFSNVIFGLAKPLVNPLAAHIRTIHLHFQTGGNTQPIFYEQAIQTRVIMAATVQTPSMIIPPLMCDFLQHSKLGSSAAKVRAPASQ